MSKNPLQNGVFKSDNTPRPPNLDRVLPLFSLKGRTAIVSGAGSGIGLAVAESLAEAGANVAIWYNSNKQAEARAAEIQKNFGVTCKAYQVNVTSEGDVQKAVDAIAKEFNGRLDVFVANSGIGWGGGTAVKGELSHYHKVINTNLDGVFFCARAAGRHFSRQRFEGTDLNGKKLENYTTGSFIATTSMSGHIVNIPQQQAAYNASKAGAIHLCKSLAIEWVKFARVNCVSPGYIETNLTSVVKDEVHQLWRSKTPMGREAHVNELKGAYLYLASDASSYCTGTDLVVDGGYMLP